MLCTLCSALHSVPTTSPKHCQVYDVLVTPVSPEGAGKAEGEELRHHGEEYRREICALEMRNRHSSTSKDLPIYGKQVAARQEEHLKQRGVQIADTS